MLYYPVDFSSSVRNPSYCFDLNLASNMKKHNHPQYKNLNILLKKVKRNIPLIPKNDMENLRKKDKNSWICDEMTIESGASAFKGLVTNNFPGGKCKANCGENGIRSSSFGTIVCKCKRLRCGKMKCKWDGGIKNHCISKSILFHKTLRKIIDDIQHVTVLLQFLVLAS